MLYLRRSTLLRIVVLPLTLVALLPACYKWSEVPGRNLPEVLSSPTRVTLTDGQRIVLTTATVTEDSLFGRREGTPGPVLDTVQSVRVSLDEVQLVEHRKTDGLATAGAIYLAVSAALVLACGASECLEFDLSD